MGLHVLPTPVWELGTSKHHIDYLRFLRVDFYKGQLGCCQLTGDVKVRGQCRGTPVPFEKVQVSGDIDATRPRPVL